MTEISIAGSCGELSKPRCYHSPQPSGMASGKVRVRAGRIATLAAYTTANLSTSISERSLAFGTPLGAARYVVRSRGERARPLVFDKIFTLWNELDAIMWNATNLADDKFGGVGRVGRKHAWQTGYVRELQVRRMVELIREPSVHTYCEVSRALAHALRSMRHGLDRLPAEPPL